MTLDASVMIGFLEPSDAHHEHAVRELEPWLGPEHRRYLSTATYAEMLVHPIRNDSDQVVEDFVDVGQMTLVPVDRALARRAAELHARFGAISLGDAIALATALSNGSHLLTFDAQLSLAWDRVP